MALMGKMSPGGGGGTPGTPGGSVFNSGNNFGRGTPSTGITPGAGGLPGGAMVNNAVGAYAKGGTVESCDYAKGGACLGRTKDFMKTPDAFRTDTGVPQDYGDSTKSEGKSKSMKPVMPKK